MRKINGKIVGNTTVTPMRVPDYNQNDSRKSDHIKNRPFYETFETILDVPEVTTSMYGIPKPLKTGETIRITATRSNGEILTNTVPVPEGNTATGINSDSGEILLAVTADFMEVMDSTITSVSIKGVRVKQLDEKFIPNTIVRKADLDAASAILANDVLTIKSTLLSATISNDVLIIKK